MRMWAEMAVLLDQPFGVVAGDEVPDGVAEVVDALEDTAVHDLLLEGAEEPLDDAVGLRLTDEGVAGPRAPGLDLVLEVFGHKGAPVVVAQFEAAGGVLAEMTELLADGHAHRLEGLMARAPLAHMPAEGFGIPVLGDGEEPDLAVVDGGDLRGVGRPHHVGRVGDGPSVVRLGRARPGAVRRQQGILAHEPQDALARDADAARHAQARPDLAFGGRAVLSTGECGI